MNGKMKTGIPKLDDVLMGGIPEGNTLLYHTQPGVKGEVFGMQSLYQNLSEGKKGVFITTTTEPNAVRGQFEEFGWDIKRFNDNFTIVDAYSALVGMSSDERYFVENPGNIENLSEAISQAIEDFPDSTIAWGSLSTIMDMTDEAETLVQVKKWNKQIRANNSIGVYNFTAWPYSEDTLRQIKEELFNAVRVVKGIEERIIFGQYYAALKVDWADVKSMAIMFKVSRPGGIKAFIPKVLVTGPYDAGKSTFIRAISTRSVSVDRLSTTVALDHGHVEYKGISADVFGTPGQHRFDPLLQMLGSQAMGVFLIVDSTRPGEFSRAKTMIEQTRGFGLPYVVIANKQDLEGALEPEELRKRMRIPKNVPILPTVAAKKKGVFKVFETLVDLIVTEG